MNPLSTVELEIVDVAFGGSGVARLDGKVYFVPFTAPGDRVVARVRRDRKKFVEAQLEEVLIPGPARREPACKYFGRCGGCAYQHLDYGFQLELKSAQVEQTLRRVGRLEAVPMRAMVPAPQALGYRNRIRVHVQGRCAGFYATGSNLLVDVESCAIARPEVNVALRRLRGAALEDGDYSLRAPGGGGPFFEQTNEAMAREMVRLVADMVLKGQERLVDAFCGAGLFAKHLASAFKQVIGIEENVHAVESARASAAGHERYICGDVGAHLGEVLQEQNLDSTTLILDPPATGLSARIVELVTAFPPAEVVYVSCNPATLARDLVAFGEGFRVESVTPLDMFPQTAEIEVVVHLRRV
jgi:23S rRNA (uracil1939-C5)-methyltransferase